MAQLKAGDKTYGEIVFEFPVLHTGWELDDKGYVVRDEGGDLCLVLTNHGRPYPAEVGELEKKIAEYTEAITKTREALKMAR